MYLMVSDYFGVNDYFEVEKVLAIEFFGIGRLDVVEEFFLGF